MTNFLAVCEELVAALNPKVVLTDGYGPITSLVLRTRAIFAHSNKSMTEDLPEYGTIAYCASKFVDYPPMADQFPGVTKMVLSPAAQSVLDAATEGFWRSSSNSERDGAAAALRAVADQVVPENTGLSYTKQDIRAVLLAIADELEAQ